MWQKKKKKKKNWVAEVLKNNYKVIYFEKYTLDEKDDRTRNKPFQLHQTRI